MDISPLCPNEIGAALRLSTQAGWNQTTEDWKRLTDLHPDACFAGRLNGQVIASATLVTLGKHIAWIGMVVVDQAHRGKGFGKQLLRTALDYGKKLKIPTIGLDATDLGRLLYLKEGLSDVAPIERWRGSLNAIRSKSNLQAVTSSQWKAIFAYDQESCGADRSLMLEHLLQEPGVQAWLTGSPEKITGYAIIRPGRTALHIGPLIADNPDQAKVLLQTISLVVNNQSVIIDLLNIETLSPFLSNFGLTKQRQLMRMTYPESRAVLTGPTVVAAMSLEWG